MRTGAYTVLNLVGELVSSYLFTACFACCKENSRCGSVAGRSEQPTQTEESTKLWGFLMRCV